MHRQLFQYHPNIVYTFIPGLKARVEHENGGYLIKVNNIGFRSNREFEANKNPNIFRVLLYGDSYTAGDGVSNNKRYSDVLETLLDGLEVYNYGMSGTGTDQQYIIFEEFAKGIDHDLLVIAVTVENIRRVAARYKIYHSINGELMIYAKPYFTLDSKGGLKSHHLPVPKDPVDNKQLSLRERRSIDKGGRFNWLYRALLKIDYRLVDFALQISKYQPLPSYNSKLNPDWLLMKAILTRWISSSNKPVIIFPIPVHQYVEETANSSSCQTRFKELGKETNVDIHDPLPDYWKISRSERRKLRFQKDLHPTPANHLLLAQSLAPCIKRYMDRSKI